jgi:hypothetical protein
MARSWPVALNRMQIGDREVYVDDGAPELPEVDTEALEQAKPPTRALKPFRLADCAEVYQRHYENGVAWLKGRMAEHKLAHGQVSRGVGAMLNAARWMYASAEFAAEQGARTCDAEMLHTSAKLGATARQHELAAWDLATKEAALRRQHEGTTPTASLAAAIDAEGSEAPPGARRPRSGKGPPRGSKG